MKSYVENTFDVVGTIGKNPCEINLSKILIAKQDSKMTHKILKLFCLVAFEPK
jgi:hypothetical protein